MAENLRKAGNREGKSYKQRLTFLIQNTWKYIGKDKKLKRGNNPLGKETRH